MAEPPSIPGGLAIVAVVAAVIGIVAAYNAQVAAVGVGAVVVVVLLISAPWLLVVMVMPASFVTYRVGPVGSGLSVADMVLVAGVMAALIFMRRPGGWARRHLLIALAYLFVLMIPVVATPTTTAFVEWGHRLLLVVGGVVVGATIVQMDQTRRALRIFVVAATTIALVAIIAALSTGLDPAYPFGFSKNQTGGLLAFVLILIAVAADHLELPPKVQGVMTTVLVLGLAATRSRGAMLALIVGFVYLVFRRGIRGGRWLYLVPVFVLMIGFTVLTLRAETLLDDGRSSSLGTRIEFQQRAFDDWMIEPGLGQGIRYYLDDGVAFPRPVIPQDPLGGTPSPHNIVLEVLAESGVVGLVAFVILIGGTLVLVGGRRSQLTLAGGAVIVVAATQGLFDIYWVGGLQTIPWIIVGLGAAIDDLGTPVVERSVESAGVPVR